MVALNVGAADRRVVFAPRARTAHTPCSASGHPAASRSRAQRACSASPAPGEEWTVGALEARVRRCLGPRLGSVWAALRELDLQGTGRVGLRGFRGVLASLQGLETRQLTPLIDQVCGPNAVTVDYVRFLRTFGHAPPAGHAPSGGTVRYVFAAL
ncbi:unnamed protein product [Lota lota]